MLSLTKKSPGESKRSEPTYGKFHPCLKTWPDGAANEPGIGAASTGCQGGFIGCDGRPALPRYRSGFPKEGIGSIGDRHLNDFVESIVVNVGGPCGEGSRPPLKRMGVGGVCATRRISSMSGTRHWLYQDVGEPLGRSNGRRPIHCEKAAPEKSP